ncbi:MAG: nucleotidyltransferase family protein [Bacteroidaceae bacterium]|nr:nucleotidyltransferase family protein [Bacteroidaceae bacterium]
MDRFLELIRIALGTQKEFCTPPSAEEWTELYALANRHGIGGILFVALMSIPKSQMPPSEISADWFTLANKMKEDNNRRAEQVKHVTRIFKKHGFRSVILKGQSLSQYFPQPELRHSSDIDVWLEGKKEDIIAYISSVRKPDTILYHHCDFNVVKGTSIEVHFTPSFFANPFANMRFQKWAKENGNRLFSNCDNIEDGFNQTDARFDIPYLLTHLFRHVIDEELELKPVIDYFFVLRSTHLSDADKRGHMCTLRQFGIDGFAAGVMYILHDILGLDDEYLLCEPDKRQGLALMRELFKPEQDRGCLAKGKSKENHIRRFIKRQTNMLRFLPFYPCEILWTPYWMIKIFILLRRNK